MSSNTTPDVLRIDSLTVKCGKSSGIYLECSLRGEKAYFPMHEDDAQRMAAELSYFAAIVAARKPAPARKR